MGCWLPCALSLHLLMGHAGFSGPGQGLEPESKLSQGCARGGTFPRQGEAKLTRNCAPKLWWKPATSRHEVVLAHGDLLHSLPPACLGFKHAGDRLSQSDHPAQSLIHSVNTSEGARVPGPVLRARVTEVNQARILLQELRRLGEEGGLHLSDVMEAWEGGARGRESAWRSWGGPHSGGVF